MVFMDLVKIAAGYLHGGGGDVQSPLHLLTGHLLVITSRINKVVKAKPTYAQLMRISPYVAE